MSRRYLPLVLLVLLLLVLILVGGCGSDPKVTAGRVIDKEYDDADSTWYPGVDVPGTCSGGYGSVPMTCTAGVHIPGYYSHDDEHYRLRLDDGDREAWRNVDPKLYEQAQIGDWYNADTEELKHADG